MKKKTKKEEASSKRKREIVKARGDVQDLLRLNILARLELEAEEIRLNIKLDKEFDK